MLILFSVLVLVVIAAISAAVLYAASQKFKVFEDSRINNVEMLLPGVNCGGCGFSGCKIFAEKTVQTENLNELYCTAGGQKTMSAVAEILQKEVVEIIPDIAVVRCNGTPQNRPRTNIFDGGKSCAVATLTYGGETACTYGCLGYGDCVPVCKFDAISMNNETNLPEIDREKCTACGVCVKTCPKKIIEIRKTCAEHTSTSLSNHSRSKKENAVFVCCVNEDKGAVAAKACKMACIGCEKCKKVCEFDAISIHHFLAYIDDKKCTNCGKCVKICPTKSIVY